MRSSFVALDPLASLNGHALQSLTPEVHAASYDAYGKLHGTGRKSGSPRFSTISTSTHSGRRSSRSSARPLLAWTG